VTITGFKSTDIESRSKVEPATVTNFGYKRQGLDVNAMTGLFLVTAATCSAETTSSVAVMSPASTVRAGDVLDFNGVRSEISLVSGTSYTLGRSITGLTNGSSVNIYRPSYLLVDSTGAVSVSVSGTPNINLAQVGGVATSLGQKAEASSIPVVLATEQDTAKDGTETSQGKFTGIGVLKAAPFEGNPAWAAWPASEDGIPSAGLYAYSETSQLQTRLNSISTSSTVASGAGLAGLVTRSFVQGPKLAIGGDSIAALVTESAPSATDPALLVRNIPSGTQPVSIASLPALTTGSAIVGRVGHDITGIVSGRKVVVTAGTRERLVASSTPCKKVDIVAEVDNTGTIVVGGSGCIATLATREGIPLSAGQPYSLEIDDANDIYLDSTVSGDGVTFVYYT
jgi:hypothetical protein